jgi:hypothetical protein
MGKTSERKSINSLYFSLLAGKFLAERGSQQTASSASQSAANRLFLWKCPNHAFFGLFCNARTQQARSGRVESPMFGPFLSGAPHGSPVFAEANRRDELGFLAFLRSLKSMI